MVRPKPPIAAVPLGLPLSQALARNGNLADLSRRLAESNARHAAVAPLLPPPLRAAVRPGPIDDEGWSLLVPNAAVAAKLRQLLPRLAETIRAHGWRDLPIRVHIRTP